MPAMCAWGKAPSLILGGEKRPLSPPPFTLSSCSNCIASTIQSKKNALPAMGGSRGDHFPSSVGTLSLCTKKVCSVLYVLYIYLFVPFPFSCRQGNPAHEKLPHPVPLVLMAGVCKCKGQKEPGQRNFPTSHILENDDPMPTLSSQRRQTYIVIFLRTISSDPPERFHHVYGSPPSVKQVPISLFQ